MGALATVAAIVVVAAGAAPSADITERARAMFRPAHPNATVIGELISTLAPNGTWPDVPYGDERRAHWPVLVHLTRTATLAQVFPRVCRLPPPRAVTCGRTPRAGTSPGHRTTPPPPRAARRWPR